MAKTVTISVTLTQAELKLAEKLAKEHGLPLAQCVKQFRLCDQVFEEHFETLKQRAAAQPEGQPLPGGLRAAGIPARRPPAGHPLEALLQA